jgi:dienelactone hydrolase
MFDMRYCYPVLLCLVCLPSLGAKSPVSIGARFPANDSIDVVRDTSVDAQECLDGLIWDAEAFTVCCEAPRTDRGDMLVYFPTPRPSGDQPNDRVAMEWYMARSDDRQPVKAPAVVVVHESGRGMTAGRIFARGIQSSGVHAFLVHLPYYGERTTADKHENAETFIAATRQGIADVRRARDAAAAIPLVIDNRIGLQGTSLGGFVAATTAGLDDGFDAVFLMLAGGDLYDVIQSGAKDAKQYRERLAEAGYTGEKLRDELRKVEPNRLAHRLNPEQTWLYSGLFDMVVPIKNARLLARIAKLEKSHHVEMVANHYSGIIFVPFLLGHMSQRFKALEP